MAQYGKAEYWEERYQRDPEPFDWYQRWAGIKDVMVEYIKPHHAILVIGCGNSRLTEELYDEGFNNISNVDISQNVIKAMQDKYQDKPSLVFTQMDCRSMEPFGENSFNIVIDKGTMDSLLCGEGSTGNAHKTLGEISRVLSANGTFICISHGQPSYRLSYLQKADYHWTVKVHTVQKPMMGFTPSISGDEKDNVHYIYICEKGNAVDENRALAE